MNVNNHIQCSRGLNKITHSSKGINWFWPNITLRHCAASADIWPKQLTHSSLFVILSIYNIHILYCIHI
jgi:hypothetical protein